MLYITSEGLAYEGSDWNSLSNEERGKLLRDALAYGKELGMPFTAADIAAGLGVTPHMICNLASKLKISLAHPEKKATRSCTQAGKRLAAWFKKEVADYTEQEQPGQAIPMGNGRFCNPKDQRYGK